MAPRLQLSRRRHLQPATDDSEAKKTTSNDSLEASTVGPQTTSGPDDLPPVSAGLSRRTGNPCATRKLGMAMNHHEQAKKPAREALEKAEHALQAYLDGSESALAHI